MRRYYCQNFKDPNEYIIVLELNLASFFRHGGTWVVKEITEYTPPVRKESQDAPRVTIDAGLGNKLEPLSQSTDNDLPNDL
jgi:hypothetical protein